jgi:hypothetical protein
MTAYGDVNATVTETRIVSRKGAKAQSRRALSRLKR